MRRWLQFFSHAKHPLVTKFNAVRLPDKHAAIQDCPMLAIDLETTGLNARKDHIVSVGWVPVRAREIVLAEAKQYLVQSPISVGQSATIHGLLDRDLTNALPLENVLVELLDNYAGYIFVAHHAGLEKSFLQRATHRNFGQAAKMRFIDTMAVERFWLQQKGMAAKNTTLNLSACLQRHHLPAGPQHAALEDAYGCALLLLAQTGRARLSLANLLRQSHT